MQSFNVLAGVIPYIYLVHFYNVFRVLLLVFSIVFSVRVLCFDFVH